MRLNCRQIVRSIRDTGYYRDWKEEILERDNYTCQKCGSTEKLEIHHIEELIEIIEKYNIQTTDDAYLCPILWDTNNGMTLCKQCHKETDGFGKAYKKGT